MFKTNVDEHGWRAAAKPAELTPAGLPPGGAAVLCKEGYQVEQVAHFDVTDHLNRLTFAHVPVAIRGGILFVSLYLRHSEGMSDANKAILEELAARLAAHTGPWLVAGDFNMTHAAAPAVRLV